MHENIISYMHISLPLISNLTMKHLLYEYKSQSRDGVIILSATDELTARMFYAAPNHAKKTEFTCTLSVDLPPSVARSIDTNNFVAVAYYLEKTVRQSMCKWVLENIQNRDIEIKDSLEHWLRTRQISEDDYSIETAIKCFQRYRKKINAKNDDFFHRFNTETVLQNGKKKRRKKAEKFSFTELDDLAGIYKNHYAPYFTSARKVELKKLVSQLHIYIYRKVGNRSPQYLATHYNMSERTLRYAKHAFTIFLRRHPRLKHPEDFISVLSEPRAISDI